MEILILLLLLTFLSIYFTYNKTSEAFSEEILTSNVNEDNILFIDLDKEKISQLNRMNNYILNEKTIPEEFKHIPQDIFNEDTFIRLLYDFFVINFIDKYIVNRFNAHKFLKINYYYPEFTSLKGNLNTFKERSLRKVYDDLMKPTITNMKEINTLDKDFYIYSMKNLGKNFKNKLSKNNNFDKFRQFYNGENFREYIRKIMKNLNFKESNSNDETFFIFEFIELNDTNIADIFELVNDVIDNELYLIQKYNLS